jgi:hypothetical protein
MGSRIKDMGSRFTGTKALIRFHNFNEINGLHVHVRISVIM